jgi:hypothetical protein
MRPKEEVKEMSAVWGNWKYEQSTPYFYEQYKFYVTTEKWNNEIGHGCSFREK